MHLVAAPDKFRGSIAAPAAARAIAAGAEAAGWTARELPLADGGEGTLDALGGPNRTTVVTGPLGTPVQAGWRLEDGRAVVEMARASGLALAGGAEANDPLRATTRGTGELIAAAIEAGAREILVGVGGSAATDGGLGAVEALAELAPFPARGVAVRVACDVTTRFSEAARVYGPQKGASPEQVRHLSERLHELARRYRVELGVDVEQLAGAGAAGGLAGGLAALGAELAPGFELVAEAVGLDAALAGADLVVTGEGRVDETSFAGKVVGGVASRAAARGLDVLVVAGEVAAQLPAGVTGISLLERFGASRAWRDTALCIAEAVTASLAAPR
ncbi:MAG TPA: glycerate kinase [Gaiellaceae bacterium]|nr:glycerate kinase [Gaiellaceae bacterium]